jgi:hypothetical protein
MVEVVSTVREGARSGFCRMTGVRFDDLRRPRPGRVESWLAALMSAWFCRSRAREAVPDA